MPFISQTEQRDAVAIVGLSCRFPGEAADPRGFWELLKNGRSGFSESTNRYNADSFFHPQTDGARQNVIPTKGGYMLQQDPYVFDAAFFNITAAEAKALDPRQRIAMEVAYEALENAGLSLREVAGSQTACFMGSSMSDYRDTVARDFAHFPRYHILGISDEMIANRISHFLDIHGPSATVQTACSSSLVASHLACQSLRLGESDMGALAGGVGLILGTDGTMHLGNTGFLNPAGHSRSFDASAGGYGRGEGCGVLVLKRLSSALRDGNTIRAIIRASGVNSDGWTPGVTMPSLEAQAALIRDVYTSNGLDFASTQYVEAHGTGTKAGDPVEAGAIHRTIGQADGSSRKKLYIGSVKPNIGHLEAAAGVASIIKGVLALENGLIPPNIRFSKANPAIPLDEWNMVVPTALTPWPLAKTKRMSISGFGMGGTNAHVVLDAGHKEAVKSGSLTARAKDKKRLFVFSSHDRAGFGRLGKVLADHLDSLASAASNPTYLANLAYTLASARSGLLWKDACLAGDVSDLREQLVSKLGEDAVRGPSSPPRIGYVFTGQGAQWARMGVELLDRPVFGRSVAKSAAYLKEFGATWNPATELSKSQTDSRLTNPEISQPICTVLQLALVDELRAWGVTPTRVVGHSSGEIAAAYALGALSHRSAVAVAYLRGVASAGVRQQRPDSGMMAVGCSRDDAEQLLAELDLSATVACVNSPSNVTISGDGQALETLRAHLSKRDVFARRLKVDVAYHSSDMHCCSSEYFAAMETVGLDGDQQDEDLQPPVTMISSVTGSEVDRDQLGALYWVRNLISPVLFVDALEELAVPAAGGGDKAVDLLIEIGPHSALGAPIEQILSRQGVKNVQYSSVLSRGQNASDTSLSLASDLARCGLSLDSAAINGDLECQLLTNLPPYPWNHSMQFRADSRLTREQAQQEFPTRSLIGASLPRLNEHDRVWRNFISLNDEPWLRGHVVGTTVVFPAAGMISTVLEAAQQMVDPNLTALSFKFRDVEFLVAMALPEEDVEVMVHIRPHLLATSGTASNSWWEFTISSCVGLHGQLRDHCRGLLGIVYDESRSSQMIEEDAAIEKARIASYHRILRDCPDTCTDQEFYDHMVKCQLHYGNSFRAVKRPRPGFGKSCFEVEVVDIGDTFTKGKLERPFLIHAGTLDCILQGWLASTRDFFGNGDGDFGADTPLMPVGIGEMEVSATIPGNIGNTMLASCTSRQHSFNEYSADINVFDEALAGVALSITDFRLAQLDTGDGDMPSAPDGHKVIDPAKISSEVKWNVAWDLLESEELGRFVSDADSGNTDRKLVELLEMAIHQSPAAHVVELVPTYGDLQTALLTTLAPEIVSPSRVHYAVVDDTDSSHHVSAAAGQARALRSIDGAPSADLASADFLVIPKLAIATLQAKLESVMTRLLSASKPGAVIFVASPDDHADFMNATMSPTLAVQGFNAITPASGQARVGIFRRVDSSEAQAVPLSNGVSHDNIFVLQPEVMSIQSRAVATEFQQALEDQGYLVTISDKFHDARTLEGQTCVSLLELETPVMENLSEPDFHLIRDLVIACKSMLWITCGDSPSFGMVDGFSRCVNNEAGESKLRVLHLSNANSSLGPSLAIRLLKHAASTADDEFRERDGLLQIQRIYPRPQEDQHIRNHLEDTVRAASINDADADFRLTIGKPGLLDTLHFVRDDDLSAGALGDDQLLMQVKASGINFRDVMASMALVPITALGYEASGIVLRAGRNAAERFQPGDRVCTVATGGAHATSARCDSRVTVKMPADMSFKDGAAAPTVLATAYYAIVRLARLRKGQSVLIHAAAGGVGQTAIQLAQHLGLEIFATVGRDDKRQFLKDRYGLPDDHIFNSRDSSFAKGVQRMTDKRGVDCVLNSLSGELLRVSWECLATFGTFVEIGMRDIKDNTRLDMRPFGKTATFTFFEIPTLIEKDPTALGEVLREAMQLLHRKIVQVPYPVTVYDAGQAEDAFRTMQQGKHRGKMVLSFSDEAKATAPVFCEARNSLRLDPEATYLFVGGLGGLGRSLAKEFVASGARHLAFLSRSGDSKPEARSVVDELIGVGAEVRVFRADIADRTSFVTAMDECSRQLPPVKGVLHMAMALRDIVFESMTYEDWSVGARPKVQGSLNIHEYFDSGRPLDFLVFFSSLSGICGNPGQAQYDAGNAFQDALATHRRAHGLKAASVNLGIMRDVGVIAEMGELKLKLWEETLGIREPVFHALIKSAINGQMGRRADAAEIPAHLCTGLGSAEILSPHGVPFPFWLNKPRFGPLAAAGSLSSAAHGADSGAAAMSLAARLAEAAETKEAGAAAAAIITDALADKTAEILRIPRSEVDCSRPLYTYGVDSLVALEVRNWVSREIKASVGLFDLMAAVPMEALAQQIADKSQLVGEAAA